MKHGLTRFNTVEHGLTRFKSLLILRLASNTQCPNTFGKTIQPQALHTNSKLPSILQPLHRPRSTPATTRVKELNQAVLHRKLWHVKVESNNKAPHHAFFFNQPAPLLKMAGRVVLPKPSRPG
jgi:hypothetical protein